MSKIQFESNSQHILHTKQFTFSCDQYVKDTIWKQFTTNADEIFYQKTLWPICHRYNLKAIHNLQQERIITVNVVTNMSKIQFESNSQLKNLTNFLKECCDQYVKDTIWKQFTTVLDSRFYGEMLWPICQRYNLKAIHNHLLEVKTVSTVVTNMSKIQFESNSQRY